MSATGAARRPRRVRSSWSGWTDPYRPIDRTIEIPERKPTARQIAADARRDAARAAKLMRRAALAEEQAAIDLEAKALAGPVVAPECAYCRSVPGTTRDHVVPRALGGTNRGNLVPACPTCNQQKAALAPWRWARQLDEAGDPRAVNAWAVCLTIDRSFGRGPGRRLSRRLPGDGVVTDGYRAR